MATVTHIERETALLVAREPRNSFVFFMRETAVLGDLNTVTPMTSYREVAGLNDYVVSYSSPLAREIALLVSVATGSVRRSRTEREVARLRTRLRYGARVELTARDTAELNDSAAGRARPDLRDTALVSGAVYPTGIVRRGLVEVAKLRGAAALSVGAVARETAVLLDAMTAGVKTGGAIRDTALLSDTCVAPFLVSMVHREVFYTPINAVISPVGRVILHVTLRGKDTAYLDSRATGSVGIAGYVGDPIRQSIIYGLKHYWLQEAEDRVATHFGLSISSGGPPLEVKFHNGGGGGTLAYVTSTYSGGVLTSQSLNLDLDDFRPPNLPNGGSPPLYNDRIIAHEMVHVFMSRLVNMPQLAADTNLWFTEGAAEFAHGGDERLANDITAAGSVAALVAKLGDGTTAGTYSAGYAAVAYMHARFKALRGTGLQEVMGYLSTNPTQSLGSALLALGNLWGGAGAAGALTAFETAFRGTAGAAFVQGMDLSNADVGAIGGFDADGGLILTADNVLPNTSAYDETPTSLTVIFPDTSSPGADPPSSPPPSSPPAVVPARPFGYGTAYTCSITSWGMSSFTNFPFQTMAGNYAAKENLWRLDANDDYGVPITSYIKTGVMDLGTSATKRLAAVYAAGSSDAPLSVSVTADVEGVRETYDYDLELRDQSDYRNNRALVGKGFRGRFVQFKIGGTASKYVLLTAEADVATSIRRL